MGIGIIGPNDPRYLDPDLAVNAVPHTDSIVEKVLGGVGEHINETGTVQSVTPGVDGHIFIVRINTDDGILVLLVPPGVDADPLIGHGGLDIKFKYSIGEDGTNTLLMYQVKL